MKALEIPRVAIQESWTIYEPMRDELFDKCRDQLGYDANSSTEWQRNSAILCAAVQKAGVEPLSRTAVDEYRDTMLWRAGHNSLRLFLHISLALIFNAGFGYSTGWTFNPFHPMSEAFDYVAGYVLTALIEIVGILLLLGLPIWGLGKSWEWKSTPLKGYDKPVPEFALAYALAIKNANSHIEFAVSELRAEDRVADPFLTASFGGRMFYIAVWDEPKFEGRVGH